MYIYVVTCNNILQFSTINFGAYIMHKFRSRPSVKFKKLLQMHEKEIENEYKRVNGEHFSPSWRKFIDSQPVHALWQDSDQNHWLVKHVIFKFPDGLMRQRRDNYFSYEYKSSSSGKRRRHLAHVSYRAKKSGWSSHAYDLISWKCSKSHQSPLFISSLIFTCSHYDKKIVLQMGWKLPRNSQHSVTSALFGCKHTGVLLWDRTLLIRPTTSSSIPDPNTTLSITISL